MFTPLFFRRLLVVLQYAALGANLALTGGASLAALCVLVLAAAGGRVLRTLYGPAVEPLLPAPLSRRLDQLAALARHVLPTPPRLPKGAQALLYGVASVAVFTLLPPLVRQVYPRFGGFPPDTINAYTLGAMQFFLALTVAYVAWRWLFPSLYAYAIETLEGKLLEAVTTELLSRLRDFRPNTPRFGSVGDELALLAEHRKTLTLTFLTRCARFVFSLAPFFFFFWQANAALTAALTVVP